MMNRQRLVLLSLIITAVSLFGVRAVIANSTTTQGVELGKMEEQIVFYETENISYKEEILSKASLSRISMEADKMGFVEGQESLVIRRSVPIAKVQ